MTRSCPAVRTKNRQPVCIKTFKGAQPHPLSYLRSDERDQNRQTSLHRFGIILGDDTQCTFKNAGIVERYHAAVRSLLDMDSDGSARPIEMPASKIIPYFIHTHSHFLCNALRTATGQFVFDPTQLVECNYHDP